MCFVITLVPLIAAYISSYPTRVQFDDPYIGTIRTIARKNDSYHPHLLRVDNGLRIQCSTELCPAAVRKEGGVASPIAAEYGAMAPS